MEKSIFKSTMTDYNKIMHKYCEGTGGGSGDGADYCLWDLRDGTTVTSYNEQLGKPYITPIFMWDKAAGFPMVKAKDPLPSHAAIQDGVAQTPSKRAKQDDNETRISDAIRAMSEERAINSRDLISVMSGMDEKEKSVSEKIQDIVRAIAETNQQILHSKAVVSSFLEEKKRIKHGPGKSYDKKKQANKIKNEMKESQEMVVSLEFALKCQRQELNQLTKINKEGGKSNDSDGSSSGYESS